MYSEYNERSLPCLRSRRIQVLLQESPEYRRPILSVSERLRGMSQKGRPDYITAIDSGF